MSTRAVAFLVALAGVSLIASWPSQLPTKTRHPRASKGVPRFGTRARGRLPRRQGNLVRRLRRADLRRRADGQHAEPHRRAALRRPAGHDVQHRPTGSEQPGPRAGAARRRPVDRQPHVYPSTPADPDRGAGPVPTAADPERPEQPKLPNMGQAANFSLLRFSQVVKSCRSGLSVRTYLTSRAPMNDSSNS